MPLCPQITNTPITVTQTADFTVSSVVPAVASTQDGLTSNLDSIEVLADGKTKVYRQAAAPTVAGINNGDLWIDTDDGNKLYVRVSGAWVSAQDAGIGTAQTTANNAATAAGTAQSTANTALANAATANAAAVAAQADATTAIANAATANANAIAANTAAGVAQATANGKNKVTYSTSAPGSTANTVGDIWYQYGTTAPNVGRIIAQYMGAGGTSWTQTTVSGLVIANIDAGNITTGTLTAAVGISNPSGNFSVNGATGALVATGATITGNITATSGTFTGTIISSSATITGGTLNIGGNAIINASGLLTATGATITGTINATAGYFGTVSNGFSISSVGLTGVGSGAITGGTIQTSSGSTAIILNGSSNALQFKVSGSVSGNIVPLGVAGILMHYGASPDPSGSTYPKVQMSFSTALLAAASSIYLQSTTSGNSASGDFRCFNGFQVDGSSTFNGTMFAPNLSTSTAGTNLRVATGTIGEIQETSASSIRFKENVVDLDTVFDIDAKKLLDLPVRAFSYKEGYVSANDDRAEIMLPGFIAEEVDAIYPVAADYGQDGPHSWNERFIIPGMLALIQDLYKEIATLKGE